MKNKRREKKILIPDSKVRIGNGNFFLIKKKKMEIKEKID